ncbi:MAG: formylmethanofuran dehydrogenase [Candidatus Methanoperedenaceae archaeon]|nr:MAG: formylmethanofuran dehydrogenase [Candidatus Methanoperedenaceae archaeon]
MLLSLKKRIDNLCDYTYNFTWQNNKIRPDNIIPSQTGTNYTFSDLVNELKKGKDVHILGNAGSGLGYSMGVNLKHFGGTGTIEKAGKLYIDGDVSSVMGMGMVSGTIYVKGNVEQPLGNIVEVMSDYPGFRKFRSITDILCNGTGKDVLIKNNYDESKKELILNDGILRGTIASRCNCDSFVSIEGNVYNGTGFLMQKGKIRVTGDAGMNTGAHLDGGLIIIEGETGEFMGAYMKKGIIILKNARGYAGANMKNGLILSRNKVKVSPPVEKLEMMQEDANMIIKHLGIGHVEAMSYHKYGIVKEKLIRMRDGSVIVRKVDEN